VTVSSHGTYLFLATLSLQATVAETNALVDPPTAHSKHLRGLPLPPLPLPYLKKSCHPLVQNIVNAHTILSLFALNEPKEQYMPLLALRDVICIEVYVTPVDIIHSLGHGAECSIPATNFSNRSRVVLPQQVQLNKTVDLITNSLDFLGPTRLKVFIKMGGY
jgi:hypothetical protein